MPELPDVEGFRRVLDEHALRRRVRRVRVCDAQVIRCASGRTFADAVRGKRFERSERHGEWLIVPFSHSATPAMLMHFGMTGALHWTRPSRGERPHRHDRVVFEFDDGELRYRDMRKLAGLRIARTEDELRGVVGELGPDALDILRPELRRTLQGLRRQVKAALVDQEVVAGLGNLRVDEILWRARVHPWRQAATLDAAECARLHGRMRSVLRQSIFIGRVSSRKSWLTGRRDEPFGACPRCGTTLARGRAGGRSTVWCPRCQADDWSTSSHHSRMGGAP